MIQKGKDGQVQAQKQTFTLEQVENWSARMQVGIPLINILQRFGGDFTDQERMALTAAIQFFVPEFKPEPLEPTEEEDHAPILE